MPGNIDENSKSSGIAAVVLAAGLSRRMGRPKMALPWGNTTVIGRVVQVLAQVGVDEVVVVTGGAHEVVEAALADQPARVVFNPAYAEQEMAYSLKVGLETLPETVEAVLVVLGDQPQIQPEVVSGVIDFFLQSKARLVAPSYQLRRGHPWLMARPVWSEILTLQPPHTLRDILNKLAGQILYYEVDTDSILRDLDTPADYEQEQALFR